MCEESGSCSGLRHSRCPTPHRPSGQDQMITLAKTHYGVNTSVLSKLEHPAEAFGGKKVEIEPDPEDLADTALAKMKEEVTPTTGSGASTGCRTHSPQRGARMEERGTTASPAPAAAWTTSYTTPLTIRCLTSR